jgi:TolB-like protein/DNA-binding winged helix-turn-helix (wHTH) protein/Tfp pilus assembly protein PilF
MTTPNDLPRTTYRFGVFEIDGKQGELRKQGRPIKLRGRPFDILLLLLASPGDLVSRDDLRQRLWPADTFVDFDHGLNSAMNRLRDALGDSAESPRFIETQPRRGYRFIAPVEILETPSSSPVVQAVATPAAARSAAAATDGPAPRPSPALQVSGPSRLVLLVAGTALAVAVTLALIYLRVGAPAARSSKMTLAVLPFENLSGDADQDFFSDGFTEEMISELGRLDPSHLGVIARTTTRLYKDAKKDIRQIRQEIGVDYVLEGSVRRAGGRVRITAQLVQTTDMTNLWAESYDRDVSDVLAIQSEVGMKIAHSLALALRRPAGQSTSSSAHDFYLRGRFYRDQATAESTRKAIDSYRQAIAADAKYAPAYAGIADAYWLLGAPGWEVEPPSVLLKKAEENAERALALDANLAEGHAVLAMVRLAYRWDREGSEREIQEAIRLNPSYAQAHQYYSTTLTTMGKFDQAIAESKRALELDPLSAPASTTLGIRYLYAGRNTDATAQFRHTLETSPEFAIAHWGLGQGYRALGDTSREIDELRLAVVLSGNSAYMRAHLAYGLAVSGDRTGADAIRTALEAERRAGYASPYHDALIAVGLGDRDATMRALQRAFDDRSGWMVFLPVQPEFASMRQAPEFQRLLARVKPID